MISDEIVSGASAYRRTRKHSFKTFSADRKTSHVHSNLRYMLWFATKSSPGHHRLVVHSNTCLTVGKTPQYRQNHATNCDLRRNRRLGINVSRYTEIVLEKVLSESKNPDTLKFARKLSPGLSRITVHRNSTQKRAQRVENPLGILRFN